MYGLFEANVGGKGVYRDTGNFGAKIEDLMNTLRPEFKHIVIDYRKNTYLGSFTFYNCGF